VPVVFAAIPSPSTNSIGPFTFYGLAIALGVVAAVTLSQRRWSARGGNDDDISAIALWAVPAGLIGARIYHIVTDWQKFSGEGFVKLFAIREGGLGIPGGMFLGVVVGLWVARRRGMDLRRALDSVVPALPLAQAIGRWGNYFNQELYGSTTDLPWGLEIDREHAPSEFRDPDVILPTFHPTFLYESLWNLSLVGLILWIDKKGWLPPGRLISVYLIGYGVGRWWVESLRIDPANEVAGLRVNIWMSIVLVLSGLLIAFWPRDSSSVDELVSTTH
jgi:prolipoprotein diacylglyceryl transferase